MALPKMTFPGGKTTADSKYSAIVTYTDHSKVALPIVTMTEVMVTLAMHASSQDPDIIRRGPIVDISVNRVIAHT